jgi:hypothetical protein
VHCYESRTEIFAIVIAGRNLAKILSLESRDLKGRPKIVARGGTRIPCEIDVVLSNLDPRDSFSEPCKIILANLGGCAARSPRPVPTGTVVHLNGLPTRSPVAARVVNCISLGQYEKLWLLGLALHESGNVWGIRTVPEDWSQ